MILIKIYIKTICAGVAIMAVVSCSKPWDDHSATKDVNLTQSLSERLISLPETSEFGKLLIETGYNNILSTSKTYTVWAPSNEAMAAVPSAAIEDLESKKLFVQNHIALTAFSSVTQQDTVTVQMLSNKYQQFKNGTVMVDANIITADQYSSNGLFHIIGKALVPKPNIWEYLKEMASTNTMSSYLTSTLTEFDLYHSDSIAKAIAIEMPGEYADSLTNSYLNNVYNLNNEKNKYTLFLLENDAFNDEVDKLKPYITKSNEDSTATYTRYFTTRDYAFHKSVARENLPESLVSRFGVEVPINKDNITDEIFLSNGIVYVMNALDTPLESRLLTTVIEGESPKGFSQGDKRSNTFYREKEDLNNVPFKDIMVQNHSVREFAIYYNAKALYSTTYQVYWRAINDIQENTFQQRLRFGGTIQEEDGSVINPIATLDYTDVLPDVYDETYIGEFTLDEAGNLDLISLIAANSTKNGDNTLSLDYLKLVPIIK